MLKTKNIVLCKSALCMKEKMKEAEIIYQNTLYKNSNEDITSQL